MRGVGANVRAKSLDLGERLADPAHEPRHAFPLSDEGLRPAAVNETVSIAGPSAAWASGRNVLAGERDFLITAFERHSPASRNATVKMMVMVLHRDPRPLVPMPRQGVGHLGVGAAQLRPVIEMDAPRLDLAAVHGRGPRQIEAPFGLERHLGHERG
jgi:hypothetical protein